ncbi:MAG: hypothetical protein WA153_03755 [Candidatus Acidiferrales bacterium]
MIDGIPSGAVFEINTLFALAICAGTGPGVTGFFELLCARAIIHGPASSITKVISPIVLNHVPFRIAPPIERQLGRSRPPQS